MRALLLVGLSLLLMVGGGVSTVVAAGVPARSIDRPVAVNQLASETDDFATTVLGNPWDMTEATPPDVDSTIFVDSVTVANGIWRGVARNNDPQLYLLTRGYGDPPDPCCTGAIHWKNNDGYVNALDADTYRYMRVRMRLTRPSQATSVAQFFWYRDDSPTTPTEVSTAFVTSDGWQTYSYDMKQLGTLAGSWSGTIRGLRFDPASVPGTTIEIDWIRLSATASNQDPAAVNTAPRIQITEPSTSSGPDFATSVLGDAWDFSNPEDVSRVAFASWSLSNGLLLGSGTHGDPQLELNTRSQRIDTTKFRYLTFKLRYDDSMQPPSQQARDLTNKVAEGWAPRIIWWGPGGPGVDHCTLAWFGGELYDTVYTTDLTTAPVETGVAGGQESCTAAGRTWAQANVTQIRFDPHESGATLGWVLDYLKLTGYQEAPTSLTIRWTFQDPNAGQSPTVALLYSANKSGEGATPITTVPASAGSYAWDTSGIPRGVYYIVARINDGVNTIQRVSSAPFTTTQHGANCVPRPSIGVRSEPSGDGRLKVTVTASGATNPLQSIRFSQTNGALIDVQGGPTGSAGSFTRTLPAGTSSFMFFLRRATAGQAATAQFTVTDGCGEWSSLAGGGPAAPF